MPDDEHVREAQIGDPEALDALLHRFKGMVRAKASAYYLIGGDRDDLIQEGMIGLYKAVRDYDPEKKLPFGTFAEMCVSRQIMSAIKASLRQKHAPLNTSLSLDYPPESDNTYREADDPLTMLIGREERNKVGTFLQRHLSEMEYTVLTLHAQGRKHADIARIIQKNPKSVDNTLQRARKKIEKASQDEVKHTLT